MKNQLLSWCGGWEKESPAGCACLQLLQQPPRSSLIDERRTAQIRTPPVPTQFPFLYSNLRLEYSSRRLFRLHLGDTDLHDTRRKRIGTKTRGSVESTTTLAPLAATRQAKTVTKRTQCRQDLGRLSTIGCPNWEGQNFRPSLYIT
jgi:hypothetical protein